MLIKINFYPRT